MTCGIKRILQFNDIVEPGPIQVYNANNEDITEQCMYSWSTDLVCWTDWINYDSYLKLYKNVQEEMYLRVLLYDSFDRISINDVFTKCYTIYLDQTNPFLENICGNENKFNPYQGLDCALLLQQQLTDNIICMFGIPIFYFRVTPDETTADYTFKEYVLHNVVDVKRIQLMVPDGEMPSSNPKFSALDFDWQVDWDVEVGKTQFATAFGDTAFPKVRDFIYIPMMKRMWKVNTAYDEKNENLMWRSTTWKLSLIKYEESTNIDIPDSMEDLIDGWLINKYDDVLGKTEVIEQERLSASPQIDTPAYHSLNLVDIEMDDSIRKKYTKKDIAIVDYQYNHHSNIVSRNIYKFKTPEAVMTYQKGYCGSDGTLSFIIQTQGMPTEGQNIISFGPVHVKATFSNNKYTLDFNGLQAEIDQFSSYLVILRWNKSTYTSSMDVFKYTHPEDLPIYRIRPEMYYFDDNAVFSGSNEYNLDFESDKEQECFIQPYPCEITNIKLYNKDLGLNDSITESLKYTTQHPACVINDLARPLRF